MLRPIPSPRKVMGGTVARLRALPLVARVGVVMVLAQLAFRAWALSGSWFYFDDLAFMSRAMNMPPDGHYFFESYGGHLMPAGFGVIRLLTATAVYNWPVWAALLLVMQAAAGFGMLRLLRSMFGDTRLVLALLAGYLVYVFTLSAGIWFAAGINQLPMQIALVFGLHSHLEYLRHRKAKHLLAAIAWTVFGLLFYEKTLLLLGIYAIVTIGWFTKGDTPQRLRTLWAEYRPAVIAYGVLGAAYVGIYAVVGLNFSPTESTNQSLSPLVYNLVAVAGATGAIGGPLTWQPLDVGSFADPSQLLILVGCVAVAGLGWYAHRTRVHSLRAWALIGFTLLADVLLLSSARANIVGPDIAREYRYQTETAAMLMLSVGLALLPLKGAVVRNEPREGVERPYEQPRLIAGVTVVIVALAVVSTLRYVDLWQSRNPTEAFYDNVRNSLAKAKDKPVSLVDEGIPQTMLWAYRTPENNYSHVFRNLAAQTRYPSAALDSLYTFDNDGRLAYVTIPDTRLMQPTTGCGYQPTSTPTTIPLDGPVLGGGWWIQLSTFTESATTLTLQAGDDTHSLRIPAGLHSSFFTAAGDFTTVAVTSSDRAAHLCVTALRLGLPTPGFQAP